MNTNFLKKFAQEARKKLITQVAAKLEYVLQTDSTALREVQDQVKRLREEIAKTSKHQVIDKVAYTWFNRLMALRFMDVNDFQPLGIRIISPKEGFTTPEILEEAKRGQLPSDLPIKKERIFDLLDGKIPSSNPQNEVFKAVLIGACNHLHQVLPFLFERINDYTDLLLPDDLTSEFSIVQDIRNGMSKEDCQEVEIIGWLYQFYISEKKDEVFASKAKVKKEDIPAATQLFTPRWIVEYMVQNTVGKLWLQNRPNSKLKEHMPYYIESASVSPSGEKSNEQGDDYLKINSVEEIKLLDQACGSGHILVYGFDLLYKIYEEEGYNPHEIPKLILEKNLYGFEIDERAAQLASMALMMKARSYSRRLFRTEVSPHVLCYKDLKLSKAEIQDTFIQIRVIPSDALLHDLKNMEQASNLGSLILPHASLSELQTVSSKLQAKADTTDAFLRYQIEQLQTALSQLILLAEKYHCVVDNPPYMGGGNMNKELSDFVKINYPKGKADLMASFMEAGLKVLHPEGFLGMINQHSWMFLSSYEALRKDLVANIFIDTLLHLGPRTFPEIGGEVVQNAAFTFWNTTRDEKGVFLRLVDYDKSDLKRTKTREAIQNPSCGWFYTANQKDFEKISGNPIGYWLSQKTLFLFKDSPPISNYTTSRNGMTTGNNNLFLRKWFEVSENFFNPNKDSIEKNTKGKREWVPYNKGGEFRKWFGNIIDVLNWHQDGKFIKQYPKSIKRNTRFYFKKGITWTLLSSSYFGVRVLDGGSVFDVNGMSMFLLDKEGSREYLLGFLTSKITHQLLRIINPTLAFQVGDINKLPIIISEEENNIIELVQKNIEISKLEWNSIETSWDFLANEIIHIHSQDIEESYDLYKQYWTTKFFQLHRNEEELNRQFIEIYGLEEELTPDVPLEEITILQEELDRVALKKETTRLPRDPETGLVSDYNGVQLSFDAKEVFSQFISYAVGCMFGRYSLDKEGLILANQGETLEDYLSVIASADVIASAAKQSHPESGDVLANHEEQSRKQSLSFLPDEDNIIPILDDEWFEDDIAGRFKEFLKVTFGKENLDKNLAFVESCIGKDIRKYFVKDFYTDHIQRYKKRPIYWMFSSPKASFNVLIYMHRYTPDTLSKILNDYLNQYREKLKGRMEHLDHLIVSGSSTEQTKAAKEKDKIRGVLMELQEYERDILYPLATERISIDLDDGVLVNYNKFGKAIKEVSGLNDKKAKAKVRAFDWIDTSEIR
jgi:type II restriction/modification system DNA methylase subunit YeeA